MVLVMFLANCKNVRRVAFFYFIDLSIFLVRPGVWLIRNNVLLKHFTSVPRAIIGWGIFLLVLRLLIVMPVFLKSINTTRITRTV